MVSDEAADESAQGLPGHTVSRPDLLRALVGVTERVAALEERARESDRQASEHIADELRLLMARAIELMDTLRGLDELQSAEPARGTPDDWWQERSAILAPPRVGDICFAGGFELRRAQRDVTEARDPERIAIAAETARRKLARAVRAVLSAAREGDVPADSIAPPDAGHDDLHSALSVRRIYQRFRRALRRPTDASAESVLEALRYAAGALAALVGDPAYTHVRASDRALLRRLHERILGWARRDRPVHIGLQLLEDVHTCSDLLRDINRRQELHAHDSSLCRTLRAGPGADATAFSVAVENLLGMDDRLDVLIDTWRAEPTATTLGPLLERLEEFGGK